MQILVIQRILTLKITFQVKIWMVKTSFQKQLEFQITLPTEMQIQMQMVGLLEMEMEVLIVTLE